MIQAFFSYATEDSPIVVRTYEDLTRSGGVQGWCFQLTSRRGVDFREEFREHVRTCDVFLLFDSEHARQSPHVRDELATWHARTGAGRILVCRVQSDGDWTESELFENQNFRTYIDLTRYDSGIRDLCRELDVTHRPRFDTPESTDFDAEVRKYLSSVPFEARQQLIDQYEFASQLTLRSEIAEAQLMVLIYQHLDRGPVEITAPYLLLGALRMRARRFADALEVFDRIIERRPTEPRGWAGRANALAALGRHDDSAYAHGRCLDAIAASSVDEHGRHETETRYNLATAHLSAGHAEDAVRALEELPPRYDGTAEVESLRARIESARGRSARASVAASAALDAIRHGRCLEAGLDCDRLLELAEVFRSLGDLVGCEEVLAVALERYPHEPWVLAAAARVDVSRDNVGQALERFRSALRYADDDVRLRAEFAMLLDHVGMDAERDDVIEEALGIRDRPPIEDYFVGLLHHLANRPEVALHYFERAQRDPQLAEWSWYANLT